MTTTPPDSPIPQDPVDPNDPDAQDLPPGATLPPAPQYKRDQLFYRLMTHGFLLVILIVWTIFFSKAVTFSIACTAVAGVIVLIDFLRWFWAWSVCRRLDQKSV